MDDGGNVLHDIQETDLELSIIDGTGAILYTEVQHVPVIHGAVSVLVGRGAPADISPDVFYGAFKPDTTKLLRVKLVDQSVPQEDLELASVPYAIYAEKLTSDVTTDIILDGTITQADLSQDLLDYIDSRVVVPEGVTEARMIRVENVFINAGGNNVQDVLQGLDNAISIRLNQDTEIGVDIDGERTAREAADTAETAARETADTTERLAREAEDVAIRGDLTSHTSATVAHGSDGNVVGQNTLDSAISTHSTTGIATAHPNGNFPTSRLSGQITGGQIENNAIDSNKIANGSVTTSDMASTNISQWTNDSGYITDGNAGWNNEYGFITDGNSGWDNTYGFITAADIPTYDFTGWDTNASNDLTTSTSFGGDVSGTYNNLQLGANSVGSSEIADGTITVTDLDTSSVDARYVKRSGATMTGPLTFRSADGSLTANIGNENGSILTRGDIIMDAGRTVDGYNVSVTFNNHEDRLDDLEKACGTVHAWGIVNGATGDCISCCNATSEKITTGSPNEFWITMSSSASTSNYPILVTPHSIVKFSAGNMTSSRFTVSISTDNVGFYFLVPVP